MFRLGRFDSWVWMICNTQGMYVVCARLPCPCSHDYSGWVQAMLWVNAFRFARSFESSGSVRSAYVPVCCFCLSQHSIIAVSWICRFSLPCCPFRFEQSFICCRFGSALVFDADSNRVGLNLFGATSGPFGWFGLIRAHSGWSGTFWHGSGWSDPVRPVWGRQIWAARGGPDKQRITKSKPQKQ